MYIKNGIRYTFKYGSKRQVFNGSAFCTGGRLQKKDLMLNKRNRIVSIRQHLAGKRKLKYLYDAGYIPKKGIFKLFYRT